MSDFNQHSFLDRHIGPDQAQIDAMLSAVGYESLDDLCSTVVPRDIQTTSALDVPSALSEEEALAELRKIAEKNVLKKSLIGQGYYGCYMPESIRRNVLENPGWYTAYTPYQPEISQGRLEVLFYFQTLITELTAMDIANASMLDEGTAAAEAMTLAHRAARGKKNTFLVDANTHLQTQDILQTRAQPLDIKLTSAAVGASCNWDDVFAILIQYPGTDGHIPDLKNVIEDAHANGALVIVATDLLALSILTPPGAMDADVVVGNSQRFGVPLGFGGPHAAFFATRDKFKRNMPGRLIGESLDADGNPAYRLALQTREQHIRREKATSNICTAQALLAILATLFACYHGRSGIQAIARRVNALATTLANEVNVRHGNFFDTVAVNVESADAAIAAALDAGYNLQHLDDSTVGVAFDQTCTLDDVNALLGIFAQLSGKSHSPLDTLASSLLPESSQRSDTFLTQSVFSDYRSETDLMRYVRALSDKDIALDRAMIPLGSCTMKLNAAAEMVPIAWPEFANMHPFAPVEQRAGYEQMANELEHMLCACTGYDALSLQPNAGSQGEYAGLLAIKRYHESRGDADRNVCLIPSSAHGTNPASAQMVGMDVVVTGCDAQGNIDIDDLQAKIDQYPGQIAAIMVTYPSTHGVFESGIAEVCNRIHAAGGQVYIDGANLNALLGLAAPGKFGGDVSHLNLHKTFSIPHGGGGPGIGPIGVGEHLAPFLPGHRMLDSSRSGGAVSAAPWGSAGILPITWMYLRMMGGAGLKRATQVAILSANYIASRLSEKYQILYTGEGGLVAHECILDTRPLKERAGVTVDDIAKRLMDYGFHAPTMSFPVPGTLMIEPTESESKAEIDRFCDAMLAIYAEFKQVESGEFPTDNNPLHNAPHTAQALLSDEWDRPYSRAIGAYPDGVDSNRKYWPPVGRVDNAYGDKNLICSCPPLDAYRDDDSAIESAA
ncbi:MAG: aminomethyl-transferring glycine dehydrogenase [Pseudomonadota bacterium]